jgi:hypothetical protein
MVRRFLELYSNLDVGSTRGGALVLGCLVVTHFGSYSVDGMAYYESALLARLDSGQVPAAGEKDELRDGARQLWTSVGGTDEGWKMWYGRRADALRSQSHLTWEIANEPLPAFELADLHGKTWQLADLRAKWSF